MILAPSTGVPLWVTTPDTVANPPRLPHPLRLSTATNKAVRVNTFRTNMKTILAKRGGIKGEPPGVDSPAPALERRGGTDTGSVIAGDLATLGGRQGL